MKYQRILLTAAGVSVAGLIIYTLTASRSASTSESNGAALAADTRSPSTRRSEYHRATPALPVEAEATTVSTNWFQSWSTLPHPPRLTLEQAEAYLKASGRSPESLLAAADATADRRFLREAMEKFPDDPRVAMRAVFSTNRDGNEAATDADRRQWLDRFKQTAPDNALADYLSAGDHFRSGDKQLAVTELANAAAKPMKDYSLEFILNSEEAYRNAGYTEAQAKLLATESLPLPYLAQLKGVGNSLVELAGAYREAGDLTSAEATLRMAASLGGRLNTPDALTLIGPLVGLAIQNRALAQLDPNLPFDNTGATVRDQLQALQQQRNDFKQIARQETLFLQSATDQQMIAFIERMKLLGAQSADRWAAARLNQP